MGRDLLCRREDLNLDHLHPWKSQMCWHTPGTRGKERLILGRAGQAV